MDRLTPREARFVEEYLVDCCVSKAALRAGYSANTPRKTGYKLMRKERVQKAIAEGQAELAKRAEISKDRIINEMAKIAFANMQDYMRANPDGDPVLDFSKLDRDQAAALAEVTVEDFKDGRGEDARDVRKVRFKLHDKKGALVDLAKILGFLSDKVELTGKGGGPVQVEDVVKRDADEFASRMLRLTARTGAGEGDGGPNT